MTFVYKSVKESGRNDCACLLASWVGSLGAPSIILRLFSLYDGVYMYFFRLMMRQAIKIGWIASLCCALLDDNDSINDSMEYCKYQVSVFVNSLCICL